MFSEISYNSKTCKVGVSDSFVCHRKGLAVDDTTSALSIALFMKA